MGETEQYAVLWPGGPSGIPLVPPAPRPRDLSGRRIAFVWDYVFRGDEIFSILRGALKLRYPNLEFVNYDVFGSSFGENEKAVVASLPSKLNSLDIDGVISGIGC